MLGLRRRRGHDLRRTFITLAQVDGARRDLLEIVTHGPRGDIVSIYTTFPWPALCAEVAKLDVRLLEGRVLDGEFSGLATKFATSQQTARNRWEEIATPTGFELLDCHTEKKPGATRPCDGFPSDCQRFGPLSSLRDGPC